MRKGAATSAATVVTSEHDHRHREHGRDGVEGLALGLVGQPVDEDGDEGGGEDAAQHDVVEHVGRGVGQVVRVGQRRLAEGPGQGDEAEQPGDPGDAGADRHVGGRRPEGQGAGAAGGGHRQCARGRARRERRQVRTHQTSSTAPASTVRATPTKEISVECTVSTVWAMRTWPSGVCRRHLNGEAVARGAGLGGDPDRGGRVDERQPLRVAVGEGELVAGQRDDDRAPDRARRTAR